MKEECIIEEYHPLEELGRSNFRAIMVKYLYGCKLYQHCNLVINKNNKKKVISCLKELMSDVHNLLTQSGVRYVICSGTLLGAYREGDFIQGDDDLDIRVDKYDWDKCVEILPQLADKYTIHKLRDVWYQLHCKMKTPGEPIHIDIVRSDFETVGSGDWPNVNYMFDKQLDMISISGLEVYGPNKDDIVPYLEMNYGKKWNVKMCHNVIYKHWIILVNVIFLVVVGVFVFLSVRVSKFFSIPAVILFIMVVISVVNN